MTHSPHKEQTEIPDRSFPINVFFVSGIHLHWHDHIEWIYVKQGAARIQVDAAFATFSEGELVFVNSGQLHSAVPISADARLICVVFNEALVRGNGLDITERQYFLPYLKRRDQWPSALRSPDPLADEFKSAFARLVHEFERKSPGYELMVKAELLRIFGLYFRHAELNPNRPASLLRQSNRFARLLDDLRERYDRPIAVREAAETVGLSPNHFCRVFKQLTGLTLIEYVQLLRINEAERLLRETDWLVAEIAERVGLPNLTYFGRLFKKIKGGSPSAIRKRAAPARNEDGGVPARGYVTMRERY